jgi:hypothetical protein
LSFPVLVDDAPDEIGDVYSDARGFPLEVRVLLIG